MPKFVLPISGEIRNAYSFTNMATTKIQIGSAILLDWYDNIKGHIPIFRTVAEIPI